jgi:hypothetical protein
MLWNGNECGRKYKVIRITSQASTIQIIIDQKQLENVEYFKYLGSMMTYDAKCTLEIKSRIVMAKEAFNKKKAYFTSKVDLHLRKIPVKCYIWSTAFYGAETWALLKLDQKYLERSEMWHWRRMEIS